MDNKILGTIIEKFNGGPVGSEHDRHGRRRGGRDDRGGLRAVPDQGGVPETHAAGPRGDTAGVGTPGLRPLRAAAMPPSSDPLPIPAAEPGSMWRWVLRPAHTRRNSRRRHPSARRCNRHKHTRLSCHGLPIATAPQPPHPATVRRVRVPSVSRTGRAGCSFCARGRSFRELFQSRTVVPKKFTEKSKKI